MGIVIVRVPSTIHGVSEGETPLFTTQAVKWAMTRVMENLKEER